MQDLTHYAQNLLKSSAVIYFRSFQSCCKTRCSFRCSVFIIGYFISVLCSVLLGR